MDRPLHAHPTDRALAAMNAFHADIVREVAEAVASRDVVVVGMATNPVVKRVRRILDKAGVPYHYITHGSYTSKWKQRLAIKLWSGWPTFPQVFVKGRLVGGAADTEAALADGSFQQLLAADRP